MHLWVLDKYKSGQVNPCEEARERERELVLLWDCSAETGSTGSGLMTSWFENPVKPGSKAG
jgi:hypothetical protein